MSIEIREHVPGQDLRPFIDAGYEVFRTDPAWIPPLEFELRQRLTPSQNPFFQRGEVTLFTAWKHGRLAGRCSAQVDREHLRVHGDDTGFFGFFDTVDDDEVGRALLGAAERWNAARGMKRLRGPLSLYINDEIGTLIEGFQHPPQLMMPHARTWQDRVAHAAGLSKAKDLLAWRFDIGRIPERAMRAWKEVCAMPELRLRTVDTRQLGREMNIVMDIYNDAWRDLWAVVPALPEEVKKVASDLRLILVPDLAFIAELDGRPVGMCIALPNLNELIADLGGKLLPLGWAKLLWRLKVKGPKTGRLMMLGIRQELRGLRKYAGLSMAMYVEIAQRAHRLGYQWAELSWTLEDNRPISAGILAMGGRPYKKYRIYEKAIGG
jgi:GNAT superfamily N-acetyltransferase